MPPVRWWTIPPSSSARGSTASSRARARRRCPRRRRWATGREGRVRGPSKPAASSPSDRERWNTRHREAQVGRAHARPWLVEHRELLAEQAGGRALDIACGTGREAAYLAELGLTVDAVDVSDVAIARVRERAAERGLCIEATRMDLLDPGARFPRPAYDVVCCFYFLQRPLLKPIAGALAPGGLLLYETFTRDHVEVGGGQMPQRFLLDHNELLHAFDGLRVLRYREAVIGTRSRRAVASLVARAPSAVSA